MPPRCRETARYHGSMFGIGGPELVFIFILALLIFGPKRLPQIGRTIGKGMAEFRKASTELQRAVNTELEEPPAWRTQPAVAAAAMTAATPSAPAAAAAAPAVAEVAVGGATATISEAAAAPAEIAAATAVAERADASTGGADSEAAIAATLEDFAEQLDEDRAAAQREPTPSRPQ